MWPRTWWSLWLSSRDHTWRWEKQPTLHHSTNLGFMAEWSDKIFTVKTHESFGTCAQRTLRLWEAIFSDLINLKCKPHVWSKPGVFGVGHIMLWGCFSEEGTRGLLRVEGKLNTAKYRDILNKKTWSRVIRTRDWAKCSPSNCTMTLSTQPRQCKIGFWTTLWMYMSGPARDQTCIKLNISGDTNCPSTVALQPDKASIVCFTGLLRSTWSSDEPDWMTSSTGCGGPCCSWRKELDSVSTVLNMKCWGVLNS